VAAGEQEQPKTGRPGGRRLYLSRRRLLEAGLVTALGGVVSSLAPAAPLQENPPDLAALLPRVREMRAELQRRIRPWALGVAGGAMARKADRPEDRHTYAVDVAQVMWYFAAAGDLDPYLALREFAVNNLIIDNAKDDPFTRGFVLWRHNPGQKPDASGTTEALRMARALWTGAQKFGRPADAELALVLLDGYCRHEGTDQGIWLIRNYFNFASRGFATNSFIIDYDADLLSEVADAIRARGDAQRAARLAGVAERSYALMRKAVAPSGLLYDLLQPELKTMYFDRDVSFCSPNDVIQVNNACATAATVARGDPGIGRGVLAFLLPRAATIYIQYYGRTGEVARDLRISAPEYAAIARLAALLDHRAATVFAVERGIPYWERVVSSPPVGDVWMSSEVLLGLQAVLEMKA
jgi:hypothetical protein